MCVFFDCGWALLGNREYVFKTYQGSPAGPGRAAVAAASPNRHPSPQILSGGVETARVDLADLIASSRSCGCSAES